MTRFLVFPLLAALTAAPASAPARGDDPPKKLTEAEKKDLEAKWVKALTAGMNAYEAGKMGDAVNAFEEGLKAARRLYNAADYPDGHNNLATILNNLGFLYESQGKTAAAEPLLTDALAMTKRLFKGDHPDVARSLNNLGSLYESQGKTADAEPLLTDALAVYRRLAAAYARDKTEGETLTLLADRPLTRDGYLSNALDGKADPAAVYPQLWADKGFVARAFERRQLQARVAAAEPAAAKLLADLTDARRRRAELLFAPATKDPATREQRDKEIKGYDERIEALTRDLTPRLPALARVDRLDAATPADLRAALPADAAVVDIIRFTHFQHDKARPGDAGETRTPRYLAFVVTKDKVAWADLGTAAAVEPAVEAWREAITGDPARDTPPASAAAAARLGAKVRELVWDRVRKELPASVKAVYVCPDAALCKVPFAALPGDRPNTVLLDDYAVAAIPHAPFLLDTLWPQDPRANPPAGALVVGGVAYDADVAAADPKALATRSGDPLLKPGAAARWPALPGAATEATGVGAAAGRKKVAVTRLAGDKATPAAVLAALPRARYAHLATHGFFADPSFRSALQLAEKDYERTRFGERVGRAVNSPLLMTGLVLAGANNPTAPGRGIVTGEQLIDLDLSGLDLAVLSACETGLGDVAGGEGAFGLQRAFHYAGTRNVVCSLWKVPDLATAAVMGEFYRNLWEENLSPAESLRQAQLAVYRADPRRFKELVVRGIEAGGTDLSKVPELGADPKAPGSGNHPRLWAAFTLSGPGR